MKKLILLFVALVCCITAVCVLYTSNCIDDKATAVVEFEYLSENDMQGLYEKYNSATEAFENQNEIVMIYSDVANNGYTSNVGLRIMVDKHENIYVIFGSDNFTPEYAIKRKLSKCDYQYLTNSAKIACKELHSLADSDGSLIKNTPARQIEMYYKDNYFLYSTKVLNNAYNQNDNKAAIDSSGEQLAPYKCRELQYYADALYKKYREDMIVRS